jgi:RimJ/RimL family protein N-acetyltransferase
MRHMAAKPVRAAPMIVASNAKVSMRRAVPGDRIRVYQWIARNDLAWTMTGSAPIFEPRVPTFDEFRTRHGEHFFTGKRPFKGRALIASNGEDDVGFVVYRDINLLQDVVELDVWLAGRRFQGQGYGSAAMALACEWLQAEFGVNSFLLRPSRRNVHALRAARRAGFREANIEAREMRAKLRLPAGEYADEVLLFRTQPLPRAALSPDPARIYVFFDSEFTHLADPVLMSIGAVATDKSAFYCELRDWPAERTSEFVRNVVIPLLDGDAVPLEMARAAFVAWLAARTRDRPVTIISDSGFDRLSLISLLGLEDLPDKVEWRRVPVAYEHLDDVARALGLRRHHALDDARALRHALLAPQQA